MARVEIRECGCWSWQASTDRRGYAWIGDGAGKVRRAHVLLYEEFVEPVSEGLELDHLCRNTSCVNPDHLEPVTHIENVRRSLTQERCSCLAAS